MNTSLIKFYLIAKLQADTTLELSEILLLKKKQIDLNDRVIQMNHQTISIDNKMMITLFENLLSLDIERDESYIFIN